MINYNIIKKMFFMLEPENAHKIAEIGMRSISNIPTILNLIQSKCADHDLALSQYILNANYPSPIVLAGGFDKNATMLRTLVALGFGALEYGTFTPRPQNGNKKPRLFRLIDEKSIQNAMGFNNKGSLKIKNNVSKVYPMQIPLWANIGKNKSTPNEMAIKDYIYLIDEFNSLCDAFVINISSPNTTGLRNLLNNEFIHKILQESKQISKKPIFLKISPDMQDDEAMDLCTNAVKSGVDGIIIANTSTDYSLSKSQNVKNFGGLSGKVIQNRSKNLLKIIAKELFGECIIISSGGIFDAKDAYERILLGASLIQIFTSFIYEGPLICKNINNELLNLLKADGFTNISEAIGKKLKV